MDTSPPPAPPYGSLIEVARKGARLSLRRAAELAGVSKATWINNVRGYRRREDAWEPIDPKPETVARMAHAARLDPGRLESEGRHPDAAEILREILRAQPEPEAAPRPDVVHPAGPPAPPAGALHASLPKDVWMERLKELPVATPQDKEMQSMLIRALKEAREELRGGGERSRGDETA